MKFFRRPLAVVLSASLLAAAVPPQAAQAASLARIAPVGAPVGAGISAAAGAAPAALAASPFAASLTPSLTAISFSAAPAASIAPLAPAAAPSVLAAVAAPALSAAPAAASAPVGEAPEAPKAPASAPARSWLSRAAGLFTGSRPAVSAAPASPADEKAAADGLFDGAAAAPAATTAAPKILTGNGSLLKRYAAGTIAAYQERRARTHDEFGGPKSDGPMTLREKLSYGAARGLDILGLSALIGLTVAPLASHLSWALMLPSTLLGDLGRVELLTKYGPAAIAAALSHAPLSFLGLALPLSTAMEEFYYRFLSFGLTFGLLAAAKPAAQALSRLLDQVPDAAGYRSTVQKGLLSVGGFLSYFAFPAAALISSFGFAAAHFAAWGVSPAVFAVNMAAGWVLARAAYKTRGLAAPFAAHLVFNLAMLGPAVLGVTFGLPAAAAAYAVLSTLFGLVWLWRSRRAAAGLPAFSWGAVKSAAKNLVLAAMVAGTLTSGLGRLATGIESVPTPPVATAQAVLPASRAELPAAEARSFKSDADMVAAVKPSVVQIIVKMPGGYALGSGVIVTPDGLLVTNGHVVGDKGVGQTVQVKLSDGRKLDAKIAAVNHNRDLAFLQLPKAADGSAWTYSPFAQTAPREGDALFAMGHPLGLPFTVTKGVLSGLGARGNMFVQYLQTDAAITHGNSGGPIYNERGEIVGINTMGPEVGGIGFSIVAPSVVRALQQYLATGDMATASMGVIVDLSNPAHPETGVAVEFVRPGSAAEKAGLRPGDLIFGVAGKLLAEGGKKGVHELAAVLAQAKPGDVLVLAVVRRGDDAPRIVKLTLDARATSEETSMAHGFDGEDLP